MPIATNPDTGETVFLGQDGQWSPAKIATNPETKERLAYDGNGWIALKAPEVSVGADIAKSGGIGIVKGGIGLAGLPADLGELGAKGIDKATRYVGGLMGLDLQRPGTQQTLSGQVAGEPPPRKTLTGFTLPGSAAIRSGVEKFTGPLYEPKTTAGEYAQTAGEFLPAIIGGPETLLTKLATRVAVPAVTSETAGQIARQVLPEAEPYARLVGGVGGGVAASKLEGAAARPGAVRSVPAAEDIKDAAQQSYNDMRHLPFGMSPHSPAAVARNIATDLKAQGLLDVVAPKTYSVIDKLNLPLQNKKSIANISDITSVRSALGKVRMSPDPVERAAAGIAIDHIDTYIANFAKPRAAIAGPGADIAALNENAVANYAAAKRSEKITDALDRAANNAASAGTGANVANAIRQQIRPMLNDPKRKLAGFSPDEIAALRRVNRGSTAGNIARGLGTLAPTGVVSGAMSPVIGAMLGSAAGPVGTMIGAGLAPVVGMIGRQISNATTARQAAYADALVRSRSPLASKTRDPAEIARLLANRAPWLRQSLMNGLLIRPQIPIPYGVDQPR